MFMLRKITKKIASSQGLTPLEKKIVQDIETARGNLNNPFPSDFSENERMNISAVKGFTMTSSERLVALSRGIDYLVPNKITGDVQESGGWKGGSMLRVARKPVELKDQSPNLFPFSTCESLAL